MEEHDPHDLNRFDPVMVLIEYIRIDNLRLIDLFQFFDTHNRGMLSREDLRDGVAVRCLSKQMIFGIFRICPKTPLKAHTDVSSMGG